jgi:hypothetical protein
MESNLISGWIFTMKIKNFQECDIFSAGNLAHLYFFHDPMVFINRLYLKSWSCSEAIA